MKNPRPDEDVIMMVGYGNDLWDTRDPTPEELLTELINRGWPIDWHRNDYVEKQAWVNRGSTRYKTGHSLLIPVCGDCGAAVADQQTHDEWHESFYGGPQSCS